MPRPLILCPWEGVQLLLGGEQEAIRIGDPARTGMVYEAFKTKAMQYGTTEVLMAYGVQNEVSALQPPYDPTLVQLAEMASAIWFWNVGTGNQAMPPGLETIGEKLAQTLELMTQRKRNPAQDPEAPNQHTISEVDPDPDGVKWTRNSLSSAGYA
jgi:hypothetical protein